jgi:creatinine amidohydrolase/Fe(II)-dependent formamide hydrolase-like protein
MKAVRLLELSPGELSRRIIKKPLILIPIGTVEWHAAHLPLGVDSLLAQAMAEDVSSRTGCVTAPLLTCGICRDRTQETAASYRPFKASRQAGFELVSFSSRESVYFGVCRIV